MTAGAPTKYSTKMLKKAIKWFEEYEVSYDTPITTKEGVEKMIERPNPPPFYSLLAKHLGITESTLYLWKVKHKEFSETIKKLYKRKLQEVLMHNALLGNYNPTFSIFAAKNCLGWKDKQEISGDPDRPLIQTIERVIIKNDEAQN